MIVILPLTLVTAMLVQEAHGRVSARSSRANVNFGARTSSRSFDALPAWADRPARPLRADAISTRAGAAVDRGLLKGSQFLATQALNIGQNTFDFVVSLFVMLYLLFFLLRDGDALVAPHQGGDPAAPGAAGARWPAKFTAVIRATVKGNIVVAIVQGALGGLIFWFLGIHAPLLWAVVMAFLSLLPAVGAALVWLPVAIYFLVTGAMWQGVVLIAYGVLVIGLVDNVLRPILVGKDTRMPDYVVLISTLGGMAIFGINGFVIGPVIAAMFIAVWGIFAAILLELT